MLQIQVITLIIVSFVILAMVMWAIASKVTKSRNIPSDMQMDLANLAKLNKYVIQRMQAGIVVIDSNNQILMMNHAARQLLGQLNTMKFVFLQDISVQLVQQLEEWKKDPDVQLTPFRSLKAGPEIIPQFTALDNYKNGAVLIFIDDVARTAQQAQQLKLASLGRFTASIAHEIRNPLGAISHAAQLLQEASHLTASDLRLLEIIRSHCKRINEIISNILQISKRQQGEPVLFDLKEWLKEIITNFRSTFANNPEITLHAEKEPMLIHADKGQLQQVLINLFENGLRYSQKNTGSATLTIHVGTVRTSKEPFIEVIDQGQGISKEFSSRIFEPFFTTERTGVGLGLYVAKELCTANGARLELVPWPGSGGCCFRITFHAAHLESTAKPALKKQPNSS